jgi:hypothetical protein
LEKEGFDQLLEDVQLAERYDLCIMSTKGTSVTAARELVEELCATYNIPLFTLHDFDISGFTILGTLRSSTRRFTYRRNFQVIDLGLRLADIQGLEREDVSISSPSKAAATLRRHGATQAEIDILVGNGHSQRVELNALSSDQLVALIERKLAKHGIRKVIPDDETLARGFRRMRNQAVIQNKIDELIQNLDADKVTIPSGLRQRITKGLKLDPARPWDDVMQEIIDQEQDDPHPKIKQVRL